MKKVSHILYYTSRALGNLAMLVVAFMMILTVVNVVLRWIPFTQGILGAYEITQMMMVCLTIGIPWCALEGRNSKIDFIVDKFSKKTQVIIDVITLGVSAVFVAIASWQAYVAGMNIMEAGGNYSMLRIPEAPFVILLAVSFAALFLATIVLLIERTRGEE